MLVTITSIELKSPWKFFPLSKNAMKIIRQLKSTNNKAYKSSGFWTKHYTMTLWENEQEIKDFYRNGAHKDAMKISPKIAKKSGLTPTTRKLFQTGKRPNHCLSRMAKC